MIKTNVMMAALIIDPSLLLRVSEGIKTFFIYLSRAAYELCINNF